MTLIAVMLGLVLLLPYTEKATVDGVVRPARDPSPVVADQPGRVAAIHVAEGDRIAAGAQVVKIDMRVFGESGAAMHDIALAQLRSRSRYLDRSLSEGARVHDQRIAEEQVAVQRIDSETQLVRDQLAVIERRVRIARRDRERMKALAAERLLPDIELTRAESTWLAREQERLHHKQMLARLVADRTQKARAIDVLHAQWRLQSEQIRGELDQVAVELEQTAESAQTTIRAGANGTVTDLRIQAGDWVERGTLLLTIVDPQSKPGVEVHIPGSLVARTPEGARVRLRFSGFPVADYGVGVGRLRKPASVARFAGDRPFYRSFVDIEALPDQLDTAPAGMMVRADINLESAPVWRWMLKPVSAFWASF